VVDDSAFRAAFGATATPLPDALAATVQWYRDTVDSKTGVTTSR